MPSRTKVVVEEKEEEEVGEECLATEESEVEEEEEEEGIIFQNILTGITASCLVFNGCQRVLRYGNCLSNVA